VAKMMVKKWSFVLVVTDLE